MELFEQIRREYEQGGGAIRGIAREFGVHRRMVRQAVASAVPPERKKAEREQPSLGPVREWIDRILTEDRQAPRKQRHTAHRIWERLRKERSRRGHSIDSIVSEGCIISGGEVRNSVLGRRVFVHSYSLIEDSIIMDNCDIGRRARIRRAILDKNLRVPADVEIGYDLEHDRQYHHVTDSGIVVVSGQRTPVEIAMLVV